MRCPAAAVVLVLLAAAEAAAAAASCADYYMLKGYGVVASASLLKQIHTNSSEECCSACTQTKACAGFTWSAIAHTCRMTADPHKHGPVPNVTSGVNNLVPTPPPTLPTPVPPPPGVCVPVVRPKPPSLLPGVPKRPNFVSLLIDDLGYDDLQSHDIDAGVSSFTPNVGSLLEKGVRLNRHHTYMWCSPTRRSFITGRYPVHITGEQAGTSTNLTPLQFTILSEKLTAADYESHFIGKGHLGWQTTDHLLINRGFHSHIGYLGGSQDYRWGAQSGDSPDITVGKHDMWHNHTPGFDLVPQITYSTNFYANYAIERIRLRNTSRPLWLHVAFQAMHGGFHRSDVLPFEVLPSGTGFRNDGYGSALYALDLAVGNITAELKRVGMWENTLLVLWADNGGDNPGGMASNWPLVGRKCLSWEGGTRVFGLASGGLVPEARFGKSTQQLMHISDWYVTFSKLAGVDPRDDWLDPTTNLTHGVDGVDVWPAILSDTASTREFLPTTHKSLLWDDGNGHMYKLIQGKETQAKRFHKNGSTYDDPHNACLSPVEKRFDCENSVGQDGGGGRMSCVVCTDEQPCLFDVMADEGETNNLAKQMPSIVSSMKAKLDTYRTPYVPTELSAANLACYNCSFKPDVLWRNFTGPPCIQK